MGTGTLPSSYRLAIGWPLFGRRGMVTGATDRVVVSSNPCRNNNVVRNDIFDF